MPEVIPVEASFPAFLAAPGLANPHLQTVLSVLAGPRGRGEGERVRVTHGAGSFGGWRHRASGGEARALVLVLHGAGGSSDEAYVRRITCKLVDGGMDAVRLDLRGADASTGASPAVLHGGLTEDVHAAVEHFRRAYAQVALVGFSLGGQIALKTACEWGASPPHEVAAVVGISPALDLRRSARFFDRPAGSFYRRVVMARLRAQYARARGTLPESLQRLDPDSFRSAAQYNAALVAPAFGFRDTADYYERASSIRDLVDIHVPSLILHAADDPIVPVAPALEARALARPFVRVEITEQGGHIGFFAATRAPGEPDRFWAESQAKRFIAAAIAARASTPPETRTSQSHGRPESPPRP
jgi:predicted alpha/beta-fold hydrolase